VEKPANLLVALERESTTMRRKPDVTFHSVLAEDASKLAGHLSGKVGAAAGRLEYVLATFVWQPAEPVAHMDDTDRNVFAFASKPPAPRSRHLNPLSRCDLRAAQ
jgi:hypothetical protein